MIQILQKCRNRNDLRFVIDLFEVTNETIVQRTATNVPKMQRIIEECELALQRILKNHPNILKNINKSFELENPNSQLKLNRNYRKFVSVETKTINPITLTPPGTVLITSLSLGFSVLWLLVHGVKRCFRSDKQWKQFTKLNKINTKKNEKRN